MHVCGAALLVRGGDGKRNGKEKKRGKSGKRGGREKERGDGKRACNERQEGGAGVAAADIQYWHPLTPTY